jgi:hypothetical protein
MKIGDKVTWTHCSRRGNHGFNFSTRTGKVIAVDSRNVAVTHRGKTYNLRPDRVRPVGQTTELTDMIMNQKEEGGLGA